MSVPIPDHPKMKFDKSGDLLLNFGEYGGEVELACFSPCGARLLTVQEVGTAKIWDVKDGKLAGEISPQSPLAGLTGVGPTTSHFRVFIESAALEAKGEIVLLGLNDGTAGLFRVSDGSRLSLFHEPSSPPAKTWGLIRAVAFSPDGTLAVVGFSRQTAGVWRTKDGSLLGIFRGPRADQPYHYQQGPRPDLVSSVGISADNGYLFAGYADMSCTIWDLQTSEVIADFFVHTEKVLALFVQDDVARWITSGGEIWEGAKEQTPRRIYATGGTLYEAAFSPNGRTFLCRSPRGGVKLVTLGEESQILTGERNEKFDWPEAASTLGFDATGRRWFFPVAHNCLCLAGGPETLRLQRRTAPVFESLEVPPGRVFQVLTERIDGFLISRDGNWGVTHGWSGNVEIWDLRSGELKALLLEPERASALAFSPDSALLAIGVLGTGRGPSAREIRITRVSDGQEIARLPGHSHQVHRVEFGPDGTWLVSSGLDRAVRMWSLGPQQLMAELLIEDLQFQHLAVLTDGRIVLFRSGHVEIWQGLRTKVTTIPLPNTFWHRWTISTDEKLIAVAFDNQVGIWSLDNGSQMAFLHPLVSRPEFVPAKTLSNTLTPVAGALLWPGPTGRFVHTGDGPRGWVTPIRLSNNGKWAIVPLRSGVALIDLSGPVQRLVRVLPFEGRLRATQITEDFALAVNSAGKVFRWTFPKSFCGCGTEEHFRWAERSFLS